METVACRADVQRCLATMDCPQYWKRVADLLAEEEERAKAYMDAGTTEAKVLNCIDQELIRSQVRTLSINHCYLLHQGHVLY